METNKIQSKLLNVTPLDSKDSEEESLEKYYAITVALAAGHVGQEANDAYQAHVCKGPQQHEEVQLGLFYSILVDSKSASKSFCDMTLVSRDGLSLVMNCLSKIIYEKWLKLSDTSRSQILWLTQELITNNLPNTENVMHTLLRQIAGGDISQKNIWLAENVLDMLMERRSWLLKQPDILAMSLYTYLRIINDHYGSTMANLRQKEVEFCVWLLRDRWNDCIVIGRDLVRLLMYAARIPEIEQLWRDIFFRPTSLGPNFLGIEQLMQMRTSRRYFMCRLTPDMETKLVFLTSKVKFGQQKRYQDWFQRQYLSTPESQSLRCDLIRYICAVIHPTNEVLCSDIIPRWAVIGWLLTTCTSNVAASSAKLSLFFDWLFFQLDRDNIMNIEPGILVMFHSIRPHPAITATLLDFLCRIMTNFCPPLTAQVRKGVYASLQCIVEKKVLPSLSPLFDNPKLDRELLMMVHENFAQFCTASDDTAMGSLMNANSNSVVNNDYQDMTEHLNDDNNSPVDIAEFSDDEDDVPLGKLKNDVKFRSIKELPKVERVDISRYLELLDGNIKSCIQDLQNERQDNERCEIMERLTQLIVQEDFDQETCSAVAMCLCQVFADQFIAPLLPQDLSEESLEDSIETPLFLIFRNICQTSDEDPSRQPLLALLAEMYNKQPKIGYHFLYFLKVCKDQNDDKMAPYKDLCRSMESREMRTCLMADLKLCQEDDVRLLMFLIPTIYNQFPNVAIGNAELMRLVVSSIDCVQLQELISEVFQQNVILFKKDSVLSVLNASLEWESIEQIFLWQLVCVHNNVQIEHIMPILPKIDFTTHSEASTGLQMLLARESPSAELLRPLLCRDYKPNDLLTINVLRNWVEDDDRLLDLLFTQITKSTNTPYKKRPNTKQSSKPTDKEQPSLEQILSHLEHMRIRCKNMSFLTRETMQNALQIVQQTCTEAQKARFGDLLALAEDYEELKSTRVLRAVPSRVASAAAASQGANAKSQAGSSADKNDAKKYAKTNQEDSDSSEESSDDEESVRGPKAKKPRGVIVVDEDD